MITHARSATSRLIGAIVIAAIVILASIVVSTYLGASRAGTKTSTNTSPTVLANGSCGVGAEYADEWLTFKHDSLRTGYSAFNFSSSSAGRFLGQLAWQNRSGFSEMAATRNELFVASYWLFALNLSNGRGLWTATTGAGPAPAFSSDGRTVYLGANTGGLFAFNATTGNATQIGNVMTLGHTAICGDVGYITAGRGKFDQPPVPESTIMAMNLSTGKTLWNVNLDTGSFIGYPTTDGHAVYSVISNNTVVAFAADSGAIVWKRSLAPAAAESTSVTSSSSSSSTVSGNRTITVTVNAGLNIAETPPLADGVLYVTTTEGSVHALNKTNGNAIWTRSLGVSVADPRASSAVAYGKLFLGTSEGLYAIETSDGSTAWKAPLASSSTGTPAVVDGSVFIADDSGTLYRFDANSGAHLWSYTGLGEGYVSEPIVAGGMIVVDGNNGVFAFH